jgi:hypothetical protein
MKSPKVIRMVLFKHGVAYLERSGAAEGPFELSFRRDEMNDVLKSLAVWIARGEATVGAVAFDKPEDPEDALARRRLRLDPGAALGGLLSALRGRRVSVETDLGTTEGEVVGVESDPGPEGPTRARLLVRTAEDSLALVALDRARSLRLAESASRADLEFLVDRSRAATAGDNRWVRVAIDGVAEDLRVSYVIPAPIWRVSYRLACVDDQVLLMAWGIVHNPADEDLESIDLTLTTGQPVSFVIDLYNPRNVERVVVEEQSRAASGPTRFEREPGGARGGASASAPRMAAPMMAPPPPAPAPPPPMSMERAMAASPAPSVELADRGEFFEYRVAHRVSIKRGGSAMVPLLATRIPAKKERIWRVGQPASPDLVLDFVNASGAVLEEGPAVIYAEDVYAGEAMVPYSARDARVRLGFAKDLGVRCRATSAQNLVVTGISLAPDTVIEASRVEQRWTLRADSDHREPVDVVFELPRADGRTWDAEGPQPHESTANFHRFRVTVPPHGSVTLSPVERWPSARQLHTSQFDVAALDQWLAGRFLDAATHAALAQVLALQQSAAQADAERQRVEATRSQTWEKQTRITQQLAVLKEGGPEGELRARYVHELSAAQDVVNQCEARAESLRAKVDADRALAAKTLRDLTRR